jgi:hypothetical protein
MTPNSEARRYHEANAGRDSKPVIFIFEGNNILWMLFGCGLALLVFRFAHGRLHWSIGEALAVGLVPLAITTLFVVLLKSGKPKSFDREFFEWLAIRSRQGLDEFGLLRDRPYFAPPRPQTTSHLTKTHGKTD